MRFTSEPKKSWANLPVRRALDVAVYSAYRKPRTVHLQDHNRVDNILRVFDLNPDFGPSIGL